MRKYSGFVLNDLANVGRVPYFGGGDATCLLVSLFAHIYISALCIAPYMGHCLTEPIERKGCVY
jgi:hypothetical protein